jgi:hypothetical protein
VVDTPVYSKNTSKAYDPPQTDGPVESPQTMMEAPAPSKKALKAENRAARLKEARPDIASQVGQTISLTDAMRIGGYQSPNAMNADLDGKLQKKKQPQKQNQKKAASKSRKQKQN